MRLLVGVEVTTALAEAVAEAAKSSVEHQNFLAHFIMEDIAEEKKWDELFAKHPEILERLAEQALAEHRAGKTIEITEECLNRQRKVRKRTGNG